MVAPVIHLEKVTKQYGKFAAIKDISFSVKKGEVVGFVGLNGAGKSTTINTMLGFLRATEGTVELFGEKVLPETASKTHAKIGFASGDIALFTDLTGKQYFRFVAGRFDVRDLTRMNELIARFEPDVSKKIGDLSRGNRQKIALIAAFMMSPELVILDEPSSGLDPLMQQHFIDLIREEAARGTTVFMSSHYLNEVVDVCTRILLIKNGVLTKDIPAEKLMGNSGKMVRVVTAAKAQPPRRAELIEQSEEKGEHVLTFVFKQRPALLQQWLGGVHDLKDVSITDHDIEGAFDELYEEADHA
jgi:ABC-2 type transport system ATP-binding protein